jgi:hypothetical protein
VNDAPNPPPHPRPLPTTIEEIAPYARDALACGRLDLAEAAMHVLIVHQPASVERWLLQGEVAQAAGCHELADRCRAHARAAGAPETRPDATPNQDVRALTSASASASAARSDAASSRALVIREWGAGFWSDVDHVVAGLLLAEATGRTPLVFWGDQSRFRAPNARADDNAWETFFEPVSTLTASQATALARESTPCFPHKWGDDPLASTTNRWTGDGSRVVPVMMLDRTERVAVTDFHAPPVCVRHWLAPDHPAAPSYEPGVADDWRAPYRWAFRERIRVRSEFVRACDELCARHLSGAPTAAIHLRATDKVNEVRDQARHNLTLIEDVSRAMTQRPDLRLFVLTDDAGLLMQLDLRFPGRVVSTRATRSPGSTALHFTPGADGRALGAEVLLDTLIAARCERFWGSLGSNVACMVLHIGDLPRDRITLVGPCIQTINPLPMLLRAAP